MPNKHFDILIDSRRHQSAKRRLIIQQGGALHLIVLNLLRYLKQLEANLFLDFSVKTMSYSFIKKVLIEDWELDRQQQRLLRDYSPEHQSMSQLQTPMAEILARTQLSAQKNNNILSGKQHRFG
jgi:hypothetical protein